MTKVVGRRNVGDGKELMKKVGGRVDRGIK